MTLRTLFGVLILLCATPLLAAPTASTRPASDVIKIHLMDGSVVAGRLGTPALEIETRYGRLKVPLEEIRSFTPGIESHPDFAARIAALINDLGADGYPEREKATAGLQKLGPEIRGELDRALKSADGEKQTRLQKLIEEFDSQRTEDDEPVNQWVRYDTVVTGEFTIAGRILTRSFEVISAYGSLNVKLDDVRTVKRDAGVPDDIRKTVTVAGALISRRGEESSHIKLAKGDTVTITASGSITLSPWGGNASSGPDGAANYGTVQPGNVPTGSLLGRVGTGGSAFKIGSKNTFTADRAGVLTFSIAMSGDYSSSSFPGEYTVKIKVTRKAANQ